jgi:hypothetical protein
MRLRAGKEAMSMLLEFEVPYPVILAGKGKGRLCTVNSMPLWYRYQKTKIKNMFKTKLGEWLIPDSDKRLEQATVSFQIIRPDKHLIDPDSLAGSAGKWIVDYFVEKGWLKMMIR